MYESPINLIIRDMQLKFIKEVDDAIYKAVQNVDIKVDKDELFKALANDRKEYDRGYADGEWEMFELISSGMYGKQCYFRNDNGTVYSRLSGKTLKNSSEAICEWMDAYCND